VANITGTDELISKVLIEHHQIADTKVIDATRVPMRVRILGNLQEVSDENWGLRDFGFRYIDANGLLTPGDPQVVLPTGWENEGRDGLVWIVPSGTDAQPLVWRPLREVKRDVVLGQEVGIPSKYSVGAGELWVYPIPSAAFPIFYFYLGLPPVLTDESPGGLDLWPVPWRQLVLYAGVVAQEMIDKGDQASWPLQNRKFERGIFSMCAREAQGRPEPSFLPRFGGAAEVVPEFGFE